MLSRCLSLLESNQAKLSTFSKRTIFALLPVQLACFGSDVFLGNKRVCAALLPRVRKLLNALDRANSRVPETAEFDTKCAIAPVLVTDAPGHRFSCLLATEQTQPLVFESPHPYPSGVRILKQTVHIPGATGIAFTFDPRCSSTNGNDALRFYEGALAALLFKSTAPLCSDSAMHRMVSAASFYGNSRDRNSNWPRGTVIIPGDTCTVCCLVACILRCSYALRVRVAAALRGAQSAESRQRRAALGLPLLGAWCHCGHGAVPARSGEHGRGSRGAPVPAADSGQPKLAR